MKMGPNTTEKKVFIDWDKISEWLKVGCTGKECAEMLGVNEDLLYHRCPQDNGTNFRNFKAKKKSHLRHFIREKQKELCGDKNPTMLIWLGKQYCAQKEPEAAIQVTAKSSVEKFLEIMESDVIKEVAKELLENKDKVIEEKEGPF